ncbi:MAG: GHKL domain-containing protein [Bacilli bacterium]|nr:GHKL domain-containing protein [Bacilli bacterium]
MKLLFDFLGALILSISAIYTIGKIMSFSITKVGTVRYIIAILTLSVYLIISYHSTMIFLRYLLFIFVIPLIPIFIMKKFFKESFIASFFAFILIAISELLFAIFVSFILKTDIENFYGVLIGNVGVAVILFTLINIPKLLELLHNWLEKISASKRYYLIALIVTLCFSISIVVYINYFDTTTRIRFVLSFIVIITYTVITLVLFNEKNNSSKIQYEYENVLNNLNEYEKMLDFQKVANHENKNQLLVIKGMIDKKDSKINEYIDSIVLEKSEDNEDFLYRTNIIPSGGLRGLVYYKLLSMKEKGININLNISSKVRKIELEKMGVGLNKDLCKIMGVILDNARQAVEDLEQKNIDIEMNHIDNQFVIVVANNFEGNLDLSEMDNIGYTTKGSGHGYGLALMKQLIDKNERLYNQKNIYGQKFVQKVVLSIK